jgi:hypothetical protein
VVAILFRRILWRRTARVIKRYMSVSDSERKLQGNR